MFADIVGYSSLVEDDETRTLAAVEGLRQSLVVPSLERHSGRLIRTMGDGFFAEFGSASNAVSCGIDIQRAMAERVEPPHLAFRMGINLGEITEIGNEIYGHDVNVAARLEALSRPQGICLSQAVYEAVAGKIDAQFEQGGTHNLHNMRRPVRVWHWEPEQRSFGRDLLSERLTMPPRPSLAVLPFANMTGDPQEDYLVDGLVEEIITALAKMRWFFVIARNTSFTYKGRVVDVRQVSRELGVRYVLEGSVRKSSGQIRVTAQLIDGTTGRHIWAETLTSKAEQIFELQDWVAESVAGAIEPKLRGAEIDRARRKPPANLDAYDYYLRALPHLDRASARDCVAALEHLGQAVGIDPAYALAYATMAACRERQFILGAFSSPPEFIAETCALARKAVALDPDDPQVLSLAAMVVALMEKDYDAALEWAGTSIRLNPNSATAWSRSAFIQCWVSEFKMAIEHFARAIRLSPADPVMYAYQSGMGSAHMFLGDFATAVRWLRKSISNNPNLTSTHRFLAVALAQAGRVPEARQAVKDLLAIDPSSTLTRSVRFTAYRDAGPRQMYLEGLKVAGLPE
jgi:TolB-like protein/Flp pilus assembly protein TadD